MGKKEISDWIHGIKHGDFAQEAEEVANSKYLTLKFSEGIVSPMDSLTFGKPVILSNSLLKAS